MTTLDAVLRSSAATALIIFIVLAIRDGRRTPVIRYAIYTNIALLAVIIAKPGQPLWLYAPLRLIDPVAIPLIWWTGLALLEEDFRPKLLHWLGLVGYYLSILPWRLRSIGAINAPDFYPIVLNDLIIFAMFGHLSWIILKGFRDDLVDKRRRLRIVLLFIIIIATLAATLGENFLEPAGYGHLVIAYTAGITAPVVIIIILWSSRLHPEVLQFKPIVKAEPAVPDLTPRDRIAHEKLITLMETDKAWSEPGLTIGALARRIDMAEHQLRALINRGMGHRNFAEFLNGYRIAYAKSVLADPDHARLPVLTIAMDAGFGSLAPFNRVFKVAEGITPSEYRTRALTDRN